MNKNAEQRIASVIGITTPTEVLLAIDPLVTRTKPIEIGEYVAIRYPGDVYESDVLAMITEITVENEDLIDGLSKTPETVDYLRNLGRLEDSEIVRAKAQVFGHVNNGKIISPRSAPVPSSPVFRNPTELLKVVFSTGDIKIGTLRSNKGVDVNLSIDQLVSRHFAILAITGAGKSYTTAVILSEITEKLKGAALVVIDPHGDYAPLADHPTIGPHIKVFSAEGRNGTIQLRFKTSNFTANELINMIGLSSQASRQQGLVREAVEILDERGSDWDLEDLLNAIQSYIDTKPDKEQTQYNTSFLGIKDRIKTLPEKAILSKSSEIPLHTDHGDCLVAPGQISVITMGLLEDRVRQVLVSRIASRIFKGGVSWRRDENSEKIPCPVLIIVEEAHNFMPQKQVSSSKPLNQIAAEGRKFGVGLGMISQRPGKLDSNILSQANTQIIMKVVNPNDQNQILQSSESLSADLLQNLPGLNVGEAIITGSSISLPALVSISEFKGCELGGQDIKIAKNWREKATSKKEPIKKYDSESFESF
ncbi:MAG: helicase HerA domain-containing protein [Candidatus Kariarchaeaceae archaeon]